MGQGPLTALVRRRQGSGRDGDHYGCGQAGCGPCRQGGLSATLGEQQAGPPMLNIDAAMAA